jgi:PAS domain S-box-containing protein
MSSNAIRDQSQTGLRRRALNQLRVPAGSHEARLNSSAALAVLHQLASSPSTAEAALALLHELQVHQVELDIQDEELRRSRAELEADLIRQVQMYDFAPVGYFTVDRSTALRALNLAGAGMLGSERDQLLGRNLDSFLAPNSARDLHAMLTRLSDGASTELGTLRLASTHGAARSVHASARRDPDDRHFLVAFMDVAAVAAVPTA